MLFKTGEYRRLKATRKALTLNALALVRNERPFRDPGHHFRSWATDHVT